MSGESAGPSNGAARSGATTIVRGSGLETIVLLHAAGSGPPSLERLAAHLLPAIGRTVAPAFTDDGRSIIGSGADAFAAAVQRTRSLLGGEPEGRRVLFGHSMGGLIALLTFAAGARVDAMILYEPIVLSLLDPGVAAEQALLAEDARVIAEFRAAVERGEVEAGVSRFIEAYGGQPWPVLPERARADLVARAPQILAEAMATNGARLDPTAIAAISAPVLLIDGERSPGITRRMTGHLAKLIPGVRTATVAGAGHMGPVAAPGKVAAEIAAFLAAAGLA